MKQQEDKPDVWGGEPVVAMAERVSSVTPLDPAMVHLLNQHHSFLIQQRVRWVEAVSQGCCEQANIYDVFADDNSTNNSHGNNNNNKPKLLVIQEESDTLSRCFCAPEHSLFAKFYLVDAATGDMAPGTPAVMTMERDGCDCCFTGPCPKPCLCCFACQPSCTDSATFHAGDVVGTPGEKTTPRDFARMIGQSVQPIGGGNFKPVLQIMDRGDDAASQPKMFAATRGPCLFGGCSEFCVDSRFGISIARDGLTVPEIHTLPFGDFASITKIKPNSFTGGLREAFTDSDIYQVTFHSTAITPQQKANILGTMVHMDYMFFERDNDMCACEGNALVITFFNCFCYGCVCPCQCRLENTSGGGD